MSGTGTWRLRTNAAGAGGIVGRLTVTVAGFLRVFDLRRTTVWNLERAGAPRPGAMNLRGYTHQQLLSEVIALLS